MCLQKCKINKKKYVQEVFIFNWIGKILMKIKFSLISVNHSNTLALLLYQKVFIYLTGSFFETKIINHGLV